MSLDTLEGDLQQVQLPKVLFLLGAQDANGILTVQGEDDIVAVSFVQGSIVTADALNQTVEDGLGKVLQGKGWVSPEAFQAAAREHQGGSAGSLGDLLVDKGVVTRAQLLEALRLQTLRSMFQLLTWRAGELRFYSGDEVSFEKGFVPIGVDELLLRALNKLGEKAGLKGSLPDEQATYRPVPPRGPVQVLGRDGTGMEPGLWVSALQADFLSRVNGQASTAELSRSMGLSRQQLLFTLYHLMQHDLIETSGASAPAAQPAGTDSIGFADAPSGFAPRAAAQPSGTAIPRPMNQPSGLAPRPTAQPSGTSIAQPSSTGVPRPPSPTASSTNISRAEVFTPPTPGETGEPATVDADDRILNWSGVGLAAILLIGVFLTLLLRPVALLLPFPWQDNTRNTVERQVRESVFRRLDRGARTYFLVEAHYPDTLQQLQELSLVSNADLKDPAGYEMDYRSEQVSYSIRLKDGDEAIEGLGTTEAITGDFFVDPQFLANARTAEDPVVLLD